MTNRVLVPPPGGDLRGWAERLTGFLSRKLQLTERFGEFCATSAQTLAATGTAYTVALDTTDESLGTLLDTNKVYVDKYGYYVVTAVLNLDTTTAAVGQVWLAVNGTAEANSNNYFGISGDATVTTQWIVLLDEGEYVEVKIAADSTNLSLAYTAATGYSPAATTRVTIREIQP